MSCMVLLSGVVSAPHDAAARHTRATSGEEGQINYQGRSTIGNSIATRQPYKTLRSAVARFIGEWIERHLANERHVQRQEVTF